MRESHKDILCHSFVTSIYFPILKITNILKYQFGEGHDN